MTNVKFGVFCLGLAVAVGAAVSTVGAQPRAHVERLPRGDVFVLDGRGAQLGVMVSDPSARQGSQANSELLRAGVVVDEVNPDSPAEKAGIKAGDIIVDYDGEKVRSARQFTRLVQETPEGRSVAIGILRDGKKQTLNATPEAGRMTRHFNRAPGSGLGDPERREFYRGMPEFDFDFDDRRPRRFEYRAPDGVFRLPAPGARIPTPRGRLGVSVQSITPELAEYFGVKNGGALVSSVTPDSAASKAGIKAGDVIVSVNGRRVGDSEELVEQLEDLTGEVTIVVMRDKKEVTLKATLQANRPSGERANRPSRPGAIL